MSILLFIGVADSIVVVSSARTCVCRSGPAGYIAPDNAIFIFYSQASDRLPTILKELFVDNASVVSEELYCRCVRRGSVYIIPLKNSEKMQAILLCIGVCCKYNYEHAEEA